MTPDYDAELARWLHDAEATLLRLRDEVLALVREHRDETDPQKRIALEFEIDARRIYSAAIVRDASELLGQEPDPARPEGYVS